MNIRNHAGNIANGDTKTQAIDLGQATLCGVFVPSAFTGTAISFEASSTLAGTYVAVKDGLGASVSMTVAAGQYILIDPALMAGVRFLKVVSGSAEGAARVLTLAARIV